MPGWLGNIVKGLLSKRVFAVLVLIAVPVFCWQWIGFAALVSKTQDWQSRARLARSGDGTAAMFRALTAARLLSLETGTGRIRMEGCELIRKISVEESIRPGQTPDAERRKNLMRRLCRTDTGHVIQEQVAAWNSVGATIAVRDDRDRGKPCAGAAKAAPGIVPEGCHPSQWRVQAATALGFAAGQAAARDGGPAPDVFGLASFDQRPGFGDWLSVDTGVVQRPVYRLETDIAAEDGGRLIHAQVVGRVRRISVDQVVAWEAGPASTNAAGGTDVTVTSLCDHGSRDDFDCSQDAAGGLEAPRVDIVRLRLEPSRARKVAIEVEALKLRPLFLAGLPKETRVAAYSAGGKTSSLEARYRVGDIALVCGRDEGRGHEPFCQLDWRAFGGEQAPAHRRHRGEFTVVAGGASGLMDANRQFELLSSKEGPVATALAARLGVSSWIGATPGDFMSLGAALEREAAAGRPHALALTLDPQMQAFVNAELGAEMAKSRAHRRGAVVVMDAEDNPGALLTVATWPRAGAKELDGLHAWDLLAIDRFRPAQGLLASRGWAQTDQLVTPGSTFKVVSALALLQSAINGDSDTAELIRGMPEPAARSRLGVRECMENRQPVDCVSVGGQTVSNYKNRPFGKSFDLSCQLDSEFAPYPGMFGLRHAIAKSDNIWFAAATAAARPSGLDALKAPFAAHPLARAIGRFYPNRAPGSGGDFPLIAEAPFHRVQRLSASPIIAEFLSGGPLWARRLALASYGQTVQASPVAIAAIMAGIATGQRVTPRFYGRPGAYEPLVENVDAYRQNAILNEIRCGMSGVVTAGTAHGHVDPSLEGDLYGKTGTADIEHSRLNSVWFAGWLAGNARTAAPKRIAFSCFMSHSSGTGGETCGKLMSRILVGLRKGDHRLLTLADSGKEP